MDGDDFPCQVVSLKHYQKLIHCENIDQIQIAVGNSHYFQGKRVNRKKITCHIDGVIPTKGIWSSGTLTYSEIVCNLGVIKITACKVGRMTYSVIVKFNGDELF
jgi:hypothetical protein